MDHLQTRVALFENCRKASPRKRVAGRETLRGNPTGNGGRKGRKFQHGSPQDLLRAPRGPLRSRRSCTDLLRKARRATVCGDLGLAVHQFIDASTSLWILSPSHPLAITPSVHVHVIPSLSLSLPVTRSSIWMPSRAGTHLVSTFTAHRPRWPRSAGSLDEGDKKSG